MHRFKQLSEAQKQAVISMRSEFNSRQRNQNKNQSNMVAAAISAVQEDMSVLENCIISPVQRGSDEAPDDNASGLTNIPAGNESKRKVAGSGSIGSFLASQNKRSRS